MALSLKQVLTCTSVLFVCIYLCRIKSTEAENILRTRVIVPQVQSVALYRMVPSSQNKTPPTVSFIHPSTVDVGFAHTMEEALLMLNVQERHVCEVPDKSETSNIVCKWLSDRVVCEKTCIYGFKLEKGKRAKMECIYDINVWTPMELFSQCEPYVNCGLRLLPGAKVNCTYYFKDHGPVCLVSCSPYEDRKEVPLDSYECNDQNKWSPELPFCVIPEAKTVLNDELMDKTESETNGEKFGDEIRYDRMEDGYETKDKKAVVDGNETNDGD